MRYYLPLVEMKNYNVVMDIQNFFDEPVKNNLITYDNIRKIPTAPGDGKTTSCLLDYNYFKNCYKLLDYNYYQIILDSNSNRVMVEIDLSKRKTLSADLKPIQ